MSDKYAMISAHRTEYPITLMCRVLVVSCAGAPRGGGDAVTAPCC